MKRLFVALMAEESFLGWYTRFFLRSVLRLQLFVKCKCRNQPPVSFLLEFEHVLEVVDRLPPLVVEQW
ncbi:hypothetical protein RBH26_19570 [Natronolimnohabitans sp. A-GB9]|uniref:hypothetical protein n=1 Tax=Natronolimnohabitans sp. A-GB9 TaxID=3069757 RepID=UPI0027B2F6B4|nr:hypothetical protein [Natronolimnohabitans sp. A-GB9]MDQ2052659.1 hypothetical protein [Natronolimnohabitans sp. A-GB9]